MDKKKTKVNKNFTKLTHKGVSLIVLIVTIIVIVILAATVILTLSKNNPIESAREARFKEDVRTFQDELNMVIAKEYTSLQGQRDKKITALEYIEKGDKNSVYTYLSSFTKKYENKIAIKEDEIVYVGFDEKEREWLINSGIYMAKKITVHYKDGYGNSLNESEEYPMLDVNYHFEAPEIEGYMALNEIEEGITSGDKEITFEYCMISNDLAFIGLDSSGNETSVESDIVAYTVSGIGECNNPYLAIPREHNGKAVTQIKGSAFSGNSIIKKLVIPSTVEKVNGFAFNSCSKLEYVNLNARIIGNRAFLSSNLQKVEIGKNVNITEGLIFERCSKLLNAKIYFDNININNSEFLGCDLLTKIDINENNNTYKEIDGVVYSKDGTKIYMYPTGKTDSTYILPSNVKEISRYAFSGNKNIKNIVISDTVEKVNDFAFERCSKLEYVRLNSKVIKNRAFRWSSLQKIEIGQNVNIIEALVFEGCENLTEVNYLGTMEMWNNCSSITKIICTDGIIIL